MITVSQAVEKRLNEDGFAMEAITQRVLNNRAYAKIIKQDIEKTIMKDVSIGSIVVALTRLKDGIRKNDFLPHVDLISFSVTSSLLEITYNGSSVDSALLSSLKEKVPTEDFFSITQGGHEVTIICPKLLKGKVLDAVVVDPKVTIDCLVAVSLRFSDRYMDIPNTIYSLVRALALRKINVIEIISTYTELTFVIKEEELENTIQALNLYSHKKS